MTASHSQLLPLRQHHPPFSVAVTKYFRWLCILLELIIILGPANSDVNAFPEQGKWISVINETNPYFGVYKSLFKGSKIFVWIQCNSLDLDQMNVSINWQLRETPCWEKYWRLDLLNNTEKQLGWAYYYDLGSKSMEAEEYQDHLYYQPEQEYTHRCDSTINLNEFSDNCSSNALPVDTSNIHNHPVESSRQDNALCQIQSSSSVNSVNGKSPVITVPKDGVYLFILRMKPESTFMKQSFSANVKIQMKGDQGYLSATEYPLLLFYGACCLIYSLYAAVWLILSFWHWQDLLRIQFWIGAVILLGMIEMAVFYGEYHSINTSGSSVTGAVIAAEIISCGKRTLARMLVVLVSIGFGIVRPRLGSTLHRIIIVGGLYFGLASVESTLRILHPVNGPSNRALMAGVPLSVLDASIFYWIFQSLMTTMRTLRLRRNLVKLKLYRHFTNTLIFSVIASVAFMIWSIRYLNSTQCLRDWKEIWIDQAYWHILFAIILLVIMILWRPSNNNQRYAFSPLIDNMDDEEEEELVVNAAFSGGNMKLRPKKNGNEKQLNRHQSIEDELRWVEQNIPTDLAEGDLPALDSEEELISTKFELSKMQ